MRTDARTEWLVTMSLSRKYNLAYYDVIYLELAKRLSSPLATSDKALVRAAKTEGIRLLYQRE